MRAGAAACKQKADLSVPREAGIIPIHSTGGVQFEYQGSLGMSSLGTKGHWLPCSAQVMQSCSLGTLCLGTISCESGNKRSNNRKKLLSFHRSGTRREDMRLQQVRCSSCVCEPCVKPMCWLSAFVLCKRL